MGRKVSGTPSEHMLSLQEHIQDAAELVQQAQKRARALARNRVFPIFAALALPGANPNEAPGHVIQ